MSFIRCCLGPGSGVVYKGGADGLDKKVNQRGKFYVVGTGPAGPELATLQALDLLKRVDAIVASAQHAKLFTEYIGEKPLLFDPWEGFWDDHGKKITDLNAEEAVAFHAKRFVLRDERVRKIKEHLRQGKDVALLDSGNPCFFGPGHWYVEQFDEQDVVIIPGMSCEAAALAALGKSIIPAYETSFVLQTAPQFMRDLSKISRALPQFPASMVIYMIFSDHEKLFAGLQKVYPAETPCAVVYWAGYPDKQRIVKGTVADMGQILAGEKENEHGLLLIGRFLEGKPYEEAMLVSAQKAGLCQTGRDH